MSHHKVTLSIPTYCGLGIRTEWVDGHEIFVNIQDKTAVIKANREGLITIAQHLLTLSQVDIPQGHHIHYDDYSGLEEGSYELIIERT